VLLGAETPCVRRASRNQQPTLSQNAPDTVGYCIYGLQGLRPNYTVTIASSVPIAQRAVFSVHPGSVRPPNSPRHSHFDMAGVQYIPNDPITPSVIAKHPGLCYAN